MRRWQRRVLGLVSACVLVGVAVGFLWSRLASEQAACATDETVEILRSLYFAREFNRASEIGERSLNRCSDSVQVAAWHLLSAARTTRRNTAAARAQELSEKYPQNPWSYFALAGTASTPTADGQDAALNASAEAWSRDPGNADFLWLHVKTLRSRGLTREALSVLEKNRHVVERAGHLLVVEGSILLEEESKQGAWDIEASTAFTTFARARGLDPGNVDAHYLPGRFLYQGGRLAEAHALLKTAASLSYSPEVVRTYWACLAKRDDLAPLEKRREIEASIDRLDHARVHDPYLLLTASVLYGELGLEAEQAALRKRLIRQDRSGEVAEAVIASRFLIPARGGDAQQQNDPEELARYRVQLRSFLKRPRHHDLKLLRYARRMLFESIRNDPSVDATEVLELANGMARDPAIPPVIPYSQGAIALADRESYLHEAERLARQGLAIATSATPGYRHSSKPLEASMRHALGWVYFNDGRFEEAQRELQLAHQLTKQDAGILAHLATVYERNGAYDLAETSLVKCVAISSRDPHPCADSLRDYYRRRYHGSDGIEAYMRDISRRVGRERAATLVAHKSVDSQPLPPFRLNALGGGTLSSGELQGKVVVMNFFALWCNVCRAQMPEYARLADEYENTRDVMVLGINSDPNPMVVSEWMARNNYRFEVLIDDGYARSAGVSAVPTAWFIDERGDRVFVIEGSKANVVEEYSARIEMLRSSKNRGALKRDDAVVVE